MLSTPSIAFAATSRCSCESASLALRLLEAAFREWVQGQARPDVLSIARDVAVPLEQALDRLRSSTQPLLPAHGHRLGLAYDVSIATAAERLLHARIDPDGPRCRSFRSASHYLSGLSRISDDGISLVAQSSGGTTVLQDARTTADAH